MTETANHSPRIVMVVAMAMNRVIGRDNDLPWRLPDDMRHFVALTRGKPIIMGRKNFRSIGRPLPNRRNIVMTRDPDWHHEGCEVAGGVDQALKMVADADEVAIIGGADIYAAFLPMAHRLELTRVHAEPTGDVFFPPFEGPAWRCTQTTHHPADAEHAYAMDFETWERVDH
ncbi:dihydrofolate reductase [Spiribacter pallidus]|jgi:dihydrofolate reductase|uniref:Dihydrofolate reductase n=1 Tax=Spiribacter pallidus TaxID=1987936 RepID=A0ABV3TEB6_9GAMM